MTSYASDDKFINWVAA